MSTTASTAATTTAQSTKTTILDRSLAKRSKNEVSLSSIAFLFSTVVQFAMTRDASSFEDTLHEMGARMGHRVLVLVTARERTLKRETRLVPMLTFVCHTCWRTLFGYPAELFKGQTTENEYMITDRNLLLTRVIFPPKGMGHVNCAEFVAGIIEGILFAAEFPATVSAHSVPDPKSNVDTTTFLVRLVPEVMSREKRLGT